MTLDGIPIETRTSRRTKRMRVTVYPGGRVVVSRPRSATDGGVTRFIREFESWIRREVNRMKHVSVPTPRLQGARADYLARKEAARMRITECVEEFARRYGVRYGRISIKNMTSRWGSCSAKRNLNFHYKAVDLPQDLLEYLVVHEVCHLVEMNHGPRFWELVAKEVPDYRALRHRLRVEHA